MKQFENFEIINTKHLENYKFKGVWALFGKSKITSNYRCLNVGKSSCIGKEINIDIFRMYNFKKKEDKEKKYINQFNEIMFTYPIYATRLDYLYKEITQNYTSFIFVIVSKGNNDYKIEKYFAYSTKAAYWVSNGKYSSNRVITDSNITEIRNKIDICSINQEIIKKINNLRKKLDSNYELVIKYKEGKKD